MELFKKYKEQILYIIFGGMTTVVNFIAYFCLTFMGIHYLSANFIAIVISILFAYVTNKIWVFSSKTKTFKEFIKELTKFISVRIVSMILDMLIMYILVDILFVGEYLAKIPTAVVVVILNYVFSKFFVFKSGDEK